MIHLYPGDQIAMMLARWLVVVALVCGIALLAAVAWRRNHSARYSVLCSALVCTLLLPGIVIAFSATGISFASLPWLPAATSLHPSETKAATSENASRSTSRIGATDSFRTHQSTQAAHAAVTLNKTAEIAHLPKPDVPNQSANTLESAIPILHDRLREAVAWGILLWGIGVVFLLLRLAWSSFRLAQIVRKAGLLSYNQLSRIRSKTRTIITKRKTSPRASVRSSGGTNGLRFVSAHDPAPSPIAEPTLGRGTG